MQAFPCISTCLHDEFAKIPLHSTVKPIDNYEFLIPVIQDKLKAETTLTENDMDVIVKGVQSAITPENPTARLAFRLFRGWMTHYILDPTFMDQPIEQAAAEVFAKCLMAPLPLEVFASIYKMLKPVSCLSYILSSHCLLIDSNRRSSSSSRSRNSTGKSTMISSTASSSPRRPSSTPKVQTRKA